jgi:hypothetical protein
MASKRHFSGIAHNIAHHAQSPLAYMHPHVVRATRRNGTAVAKLDLLSDQPWPIGFVVDTPLQLATEALQEKFQDMVSGAGLDIGDLATASLSFLPLAWTDNSTSEVHALLVTKDGKRFEHAVPVDWLGG